MDVYLREMTARVQDKPSDADYEMVSLTVMAWVAGGIVAALLVAVAVGCDRGEEPYAELVGALRCAIGWLGI